ncbi:cytochrome P450 [Kibdelosporangium lantanae]|uniref:Cytochrome P450 n=1 Tax=Kibdelosporangium lantanae TaxID=1497396 RepID=A0ABW3M4R6_9PSEU
MLTELEADPYPAYARLRKENPVLWLPDVRQWLVTRWRDVHTVLTDRDRFTTDQPESPMVDVCGGKPLLFREGESHRDLRTAIGDDFRSVDAIVRPIATRIAADLVPFGRAELSADYFEPVGVAAFAALLGVESGVWAEWGNVLVAVANNFGRDRTLNATAAAVLAHDAPIVRRLRELSDDSVISHLLGPDGSRPDSDVLPVLKHLALSALEPGWLAGWTLLALWSTPDQFTQVRNDPASAGSAVAEALRWSSPVGVLGRRTTRAVTLAGQDIPAEAMIAAAVASANRDEEVFPEPDRFDIHRDAPEHLGFGAGVHHCPAPPFVLSVARTALDVLLERMPSVRPTPAWRPVPHGWKLRPPGPLDAVWDVVTSRG